MNYQKAMEVLKHTGANAKNADIKLGLEKIGQLLELLGNPQKKTKFIHVAGTNGKGSVSTMLASILSNAGYKTGFFTSPEIYCYEEQIRIDGQNIPKEKLVELTGQINLALAKMDEKPTSFELTAALGFLYFASENCDIVVLEVGMGGLLDATNIIDSNLLSVIVNIDFDHMAFLGHTIEEIASQKAGIIKKGCDCLSALQREEAMQVLLDRCRECKSSLFYLKKADDSFAEYDYIEGLKILERKEDCQIISYKDYTNLKLSLLGDYQARNAALVLEAICLLAKKGFPVEEQSIRDGLISVKWPGRFELLLKNPYVYVDGAHNPHGVKALVENLNTYFPGEKFLFLTGILADKDYKSMLKMTADYAQCFVTITPDNPRALSAVDCAKEVESLAIKALPALSEKDAIRKIVDLARNEYKSSRIIAFGSLYSMAHIRDEFIELFGEY